MVIAWSAVGVHDLSMVTTWSAVGVYYHSMVTTWSAVVQDILECWCSGPEYGHCLECCMCS